MEPRTDVPPAPSPLTSQNMTNSPSTSKRLISTSTLAALLIAAPLCGAIEAALSPLTNSTTEADLGAISAHVTRFEVSAVIGLIGTFCLLPAVLGLMERTVQRAPWASRVAAVAAVVSIPAFVGMRMGSAIELQGLRNGLPNRTTADLLDNLEASPVNPIAAPIAVLFLLGTLVGLIAVGVAIWRAGLPKPAAVLVALFPVADAGLEAVGTVYAHVILVVGLAWVATALLRAERRTDGVRLPVTSTADVVSVA